MRLQKIEAHARLMTVEGACMSSRQATILVVDDDEHVIDLAVVILKSLGYEVIPTHDPSHALAVIKYCPWVDLLLTDVAMPAMNGWDLAFEARKIRPDLKILYTTGYSRAALPKGKNAGAMPLLTKPWRVDQLEEIVRQSLNS